MNKFSRMVLFALAAVLSAVGSAPALSRYAKLGNPQFGSVRWTEGFWAERFAVCRDVMVPNMWRLLSDPNVSHAWENFLIAAGKKEGQHRGPKWNDGDFYKWLEAAAYVYAVTKDEVLNRQMDEIIEVIGAAQRPDGYIHTPVLIAQRTGAAQAAEFAQRLDFETYNMGHLMTCACVHYQATGKTTLLQIARKAADYLYGVYKTRPETLAANAICPSHYMGTADLYRITGEPRYLELLKGLMEIRSLYKNGMDDNQDRIPFYEQREAVGHAVRANYLYAGAADLLAETGDERLRTPLESIWKDVVSRKLYIIGATGALYNGASPDGSWKQDSIQPVHQAYGRPYQLPNLTAHNESCATVGFVLWNKRMLMLTGEARYADAMEQALYNGVLAAVSLDGTKFFYTNPLRVTKDLPFELRWSRYRQPYISCFCCPPNVVRMIAESAEYAYSLSPEGVYVHLYGGNVLETKLLSGQKIRLRQMTDYPWDGTVLLTMEESPKEPFTVFVRIPGWSAGARIRINGRTAAAQAAPSQYVPLRRTWNAGDRIELEFPMELQWMEGHPLAEEIRGQAALQRGPIVYCLESADLPEGIRPADASVRPSDDWKARRRQDLLGGVVVVEGRGYIADGRPWGDELYRPVRLKKPDSIRLCLVPYYAWGNRGEGEMCVWLPVR
ncbi:MAG TPA: glycoside hydrolase family 127 protein [Anaerohalosphaeraceae bacterium]|nr:glycoside hydrolase family 127 protein [Anaerohalosphaeraceae bacterium]